MKHFQVTERKNAGACLQLTGHLHDPVVLPLGGHRGHLHAQLGAVAPQVAGVDGHLAGVVAEAVGGGREGDRGVHGGSGSGCKNGELV